MNDMNTDKSGVKSVRRIIAFAGLVLLCGMYIALIILAFIDFPGWKNVFIGCIGATIVIPILIWINIYLFDRIIASRHNKD